MNSGHQDGSNKGSFGSQQDQKSMPEGFGVFGSPPVGFGIQQQTQKMGQGGFGMMIQPPKISPGNMSGSQGGFENLGTSHSDQKLNQSGQESGVCGSNVEQCHNQNVSQTDLGLFGGVQDQLGPQKSFGGPGVAHQNVGNSKDSPHIQQLLPFQEVSAQEKMPEYNLMEDQKGDGKGGVELKDEFLKNSAGGIPGLDLLPEQRPNEKDNNDAHAKAEERDLSVGHDKDERLEGVQTSFIGPMPGPPPCADGALDIKPVQENPNCQVTQGAQGFGQGGQGPPGKMDLGQVPQGFGAGNQGLPSKTDMGPGSQGFAGGSQGAPNFGSSSHGPQGQDSGSPGLGSGPSGPPFFGIGNESSHSFGSTHNFGTGNQGHSVYSVINESQSSQNMRQGNQDDFGAGNQGFSNQSFGSENQPPGSMHNVGQGNRGPNNCPGFGNQGSMNVQNFGTNQGFGNHEPPNSQHFPNMSQDFGPIDNNQGYGMNQDFRSNHGPMNAPNFGNQGHDNHQCFGNGASSNVHGFGNQGGLNPQAFGNQAPLNSQGLGNQSMLNSQAFGNQRQSNSQNFDNKGQASNLQGFGTNSQEFSGPNSHGTGFGPSNQAPSNTFGPQGSGPWKDNVDNKPWNQCDSGTPTHGKDSGASLGGRSDFQAPRDNVQNVYDTFRGSRDGFQGHRDMESFPGIKDNLTSSRDSVHGMRENTLGSRDSFHGMRDNVMGPQEGFQGSRDSYDRFQATPRGDMKGPQGGFPLEGDVDRGGSQDSPPPSDLLEGDFGSDMNMRDRPRERGSLGWQRGSSGSRIDTDQRMAAEKDRIKDMKSENESGTRQARWSTTDDSNEYAQRLDSNQDLLSLQPGPDTTGREDKNVNYRRCRKTTPRLDSNQDLLSLQPGPDTTGREDKNVNYRRCRKTTPRLDSNQDLLSLQPGPDTTGREDKNVNYRRCRKTTPRLDSNQDLLSLQPGPDTTGREDKNVNYRRCRKTTPRLNESGTCQAEDVSNVDSEIDIIRRIKQTRDIPH